MDTIPSLQRGDIMLYRPKGIFGRIIQVKTWHRISHVEIHDGDGKSLASRDGLGVDRYPVRLTELAYLLRPQVPLNFTAGETYFESMKGTPYGWLDLLDFTGMNVDRKGIVCSPFAAGYLRACGWRVFPVDPINKVSPFQFIDLIGDDCHLVYCDDDSECMAEMAGK